MPCEISGVSYQGLSCSASALNLYNLLVQSELYFDQFVMKTRYISCLGYNIRPYIAPKKILVAVSDFYNNWI